MVTMPASELPSVPVKEGTITFTVGDETFSTWYKLVGVLDSRSKRPLVVLHGGPGLTHDYLLPLADLGTARPVILYDQIGNGHSSRAADQPASFWTINLMIDELVNLLRHFDIEDDFDVLGHSWGAQMLSEYLIRRSPVGLKRAVFTNPASNIADYEKTRVEQVMRMPEWVQEAMMKGFSDTPEFRRALEFYMSVHVCRVSPLPEDVLRSVDYGLKDPHVSDIFFAGELKDWNIEDRLHRISVTSLVINGRYDASQDVVVAPFFWRILRAKWVRFEEGSHMPYWEVRERYMQLVTDFLDGRGPTWL